ncbi:hypothetical protein GCM10022248_49040 [Nonomuraea soli]
MVGGDEAEQHVEGGGLAGAVGAEQADHLAGADGQVEAVDGGDGSETFGEGTCFEEMHHARMRKRGRTGQRVFTVLTAARALPPTAGRRREGRVAV